MALTRDDGREADIWIIDVASQSAPRKLTFDGHSRFPIWSPAGTIALQSERNDTRPIVVLPADGSTPRLLQRRRLESLTGPSLSRATGSNSCFRS
ncbi:MAG: hypothetical protein C5B57_13590 [Blastocatellia bacterium]|nr:MAG: hypothetical protein C5B57_13590 [Blastocatellia bacterium]